MTENLFKAITMVFYLFYYFLVVSPQLRDTYNQNRISFMLWARLSDDVDRETAVLGLLQAYGCGLVLVS